VIDFSKNIFFNRDECNLIIDFFMKNGEVFFYEKKEENEWDCRRSEDVEFKNFIIQKIIDLHRENKISFWFDFKSFSIRNVNISLTRYYEGRFLELHRDVTSSYTTVISLTDDYSDGRFVLSNGMSDSIHDVNNTKVELKLGEGITFEGNKTSHGVMPVVTGMRCALNIWMNNTDFEYHSKDKQKKII